MRWLSIVAAAIACGVSCLATAHPASDWSDALAQCEPRPGMFPRSAAILHLAFFDAANAVERRYASYRPAPAFAKPASGAAAAAAAAHAVLRALCPASAESADRRLAAALGSVPVAERDNSLLLGISVAQALLAERDADGWGADEEYRPETAPGRYVPTVTPVGSAVPKARTFAIGPYEPFRPEPPLDLASAQWARDLEEVKAYGGERSSRRDAAQTSRARLIALSHGRFYLTPAAEAVRQAQLPLVEGARVLALLAVAMADGHVVNFATKYHYGFWRPVTAIRNADRDGNDATTRDPSWKPLVETPMHPEYPCQHCLAASITATVLAATLRDSPALVLRGPADTGTLRVALADLVPLTIDGRVHAGIHYRSSGLAGAALGERVARHVMREILGAAP